MPIPFIGRFYGSFFLISIRSFGLCLAIFLGSIPILAAQQTKNTLIKGKVINAQTSSPIPYATLRFARAKFGTISDTTGSFTIKRPLVSDSLKVHSIGFQPKIVFIDPKINQELEIQLEPEIYSLKEVVILPNERENPAHRILRGIIDNKKFNDPDNWDAYQHEVYNKIEAGFEGDIPIPQQKVLGPLGFVFDYVDTTTKPPFLSVFMTEAISDFYYRKHPETLKEHIRATRVSGVKNESISRLMGNTYQRVNIYKNNIILLNKSFVGPISRYGLQFYRYYLMDSTYFGGNKAYLIQYKPRRKQELTFSGQFWVNDSSFSIREIECTVAEDANVNFVKTLQFKQSFTEQSSGHWTLSKDRLVLVGKIGLIQREEDPRFIVYKTTTFRNHVINQLKHATFYRNPTVTTVEKNVHDRSAEFWLKHRHETLSKREQRTYQMVDSLKEDPIFKFFRFLGYGYIQTPYFEFGPYFNTYSFNPVEEHRIRMGGVTSNTLSKMTELSVYGAYGTGDKAFKYGTKLRQYLTKQPRRMFTFGAKEDMELLGSNGSLIFSTDNVFASSLTRNPLDKLNLVQEQYLNYENEWVEGISNQISFKRRKLMPRGSIIYERPRDGIPAESVSEIKTSELSLSFHFGWKEKFLYGEFERTSLGTTFPIFDITYSQGFKGVLGGEYSFNKWSAQLRHHLRLGRLGYADWFLKGGKIYGQLPYPLLEIHAGNETPFYDEFAFSTMNFFEFVSDTYLQAKLSWHLQGMLLNKVPLIRRLKFREVIGAKAVVGRLDPNHEQELLLPSFMFVPEQPFVEASIGIENIMRVFRLDAVWRLSYLDNPNIARFVVQVSSKFEF